MSTEGPTGATGPSLGGAYGLEGDRLKADRLHRDLFPVPLLSEEPRSVHGGHRSARRCQARRRETQRVNSGLMALNWMSGHKAKGSVPRGRVESQLLQGEVQPELKAWCEGAESQLG